MGHDTSHGPGVPSPRFFPIVVVWGIAASKALSRLIVSAMRICESNVGSGMRARGTEVSSGGSPERSMSTNQTTSGEHPPTDDVHGPREPGVVIGCADRDDLAGQWVGLDPAVL